MLKDNDYIYLPKKINEVYVYGAVRNPGSYPFYSNMESADYAGLAGKTERAASDSRIKIMKKGTNKVLKGGNIEIESKRLSSIHWSNHINSNSCKSCWHY